MVGLFANILGRLGQPRQGVTESVTPDPVAADIDASLAVRRAGREAQQEAHDRAQTTLRAKKLARDPAIRDRDIIMGAR